MNISTKYNAKINFYSIQNGSTQKSINMHLTSNTFCDVFVKSQPTIVSTEALESKKNNHETFIEKVNIPNNYTESYKSLIPSEYFEWMDLNDPELISFFEKEENLFAFMGFVDYMVNLGIDPEELNDIKLCTNGTDSLTSEQINLLRSKSDVTNMTDDERVNLLFELNKLGAISFKELIHSCVFTVDTSKEGEISEERYSLMYNSGFLGKYSKSTNWIDLIKLMQNEDLSTYNDLLNQGRDLGDWFLTRHDNILSIFNLLVEYNEKYNSDV